jgi:hypothetical protein
MKERHMCSVLRMSQTRKQKVLQQVQRQRRQRTIITVAIVTILIAIIVGAILFLPRPGPDPVQLPSYLSHCVTGTFVIHSHPNLTITISGVPQTIPVTYDSSCQQPIHTHDSTGVLHVETDQNINYTLGDWFLLWGYYARSTTIATFNSTQILSYKAGPGTGHMLNMTVNGNPDTNTTHFKDGNPSDFQSLILPPYAGATSNACLLSPNCSPFNIVITYT